MKSNFDYGLGIDWAKKRREDFENNSMALIQQQKEIRFEQFCRQNKIANVVLSNACIRENDIGNFVLSTELFKSNFFLLLN